MKPEKLPSRLNKMPRSFLREDFDLDLGLKLMSNHVTLLSPAVGLMVDWATVMGWPDQSRFFYLT